MIDKIDRDIIRVLREDGRATHREIGASVGLSANAAGVRVNRLLGDGIIAGIHAHVDHAAMGRPLEADVDCWVSERNDVAAAAFEDFVLSDERIVDAVYLTGKVDYRLRVVVASPQDLDDLLTSLKREAYIAETDTRLILRRYVHLPG